MARYGEIIDLYFTNSGDFRIGDNGDLQDTTVESLRGFIQRVLTRVMSAPGEWAATPDVGAGLGDFVGRPNTAETAARIHDRLVAELSKEDLTRGAELAVDIFPVSPVAIAIILVITPPRSSGQVVLTFTYDMRDNRLIPRNT